MKRLLSILFIALLCTDMVSAQPAARLREQAKKQQQTTQGLKSARSDIVPVRRRLPDEDVAWRRDIYRELDLNNEANAGLYYPVEPIGQQMSPLHLHLQAW